MSQPHSGHTYMEGDMCLSTTGHTEGCARSFLMQALCKAEKAATILGDRLFHLSHFCALCRDFGARARRLQRLLRQ